jgi:hypothetical protein
VHKDHKDKRRRGKDPRLRLRQRRCTRKRTGPRKRRTLWCLQHRHGPRRDQREPPPRPATRNLRQRPSTSARTVQAGRAAPKLRRPWPDVPSTGTRKPASSRASSTTRMKAPAETGTSFPSGSAYAIRSRPSPVEGRPRSRCCPTIASPSLCQRAMWSAWVCKYAPGPKWWS